MSKNSFIAEKPIKNHYGHYRNCYFYSDEEYPSCEKYKKIWDSIDCKDCETFVSTGDVKKYVESHIDSIRDFYLNHVNELKGNT